jgi:hypothetical protein
VVAEIDCCCLGRAIITLAQQRVAVNQSPHGAYTLSLCTGSATLHPTIREKRSKPEQTRPKPERTGPSQNEQDQTQPKQKQVSPALPGPAGLLLYLFQGCRHMRKYFFTRPSHCMKTPWCYSQDWARSLKAVHQLLVITLSAM